MADDPRHTPDDAEQGAVPDPHRSEPTPAPDAHTRPEAEGVVRPDQQEELGPIEGLMHASAVEATAEVTGSAEAEAEAERLGVEGEGVEAAQIFSIMLATAVTLGLAVFGVFFLVAAERDTERIERDAVDLYPELREVERVYAEMGNYSRTDDVYRIPIEAAMAKVAEDYYARQGDGAVPAPDDFDTLYLDPADDGTAGHNPADAAVAAGAALGEAAPAADDLGADALDAEPEPLTDETEADPDGR